MESGPSHGGPELGEGVRALWGTPLPRLHLCGAGQPAGPGSPGSGQPLPFDLSFIHGFTLDEVMTHVTLGT